MRTLTDHIVEGDSVNHQLEIVVLDEPGQGGASHKYRIFKPVDYMEKTPAECNIEFQNGPIKEFGVNGITQEALLAIVMDRLRAFQAGPFACDANAAALIHCTSPLSLLQARTRARIARGVEGTHKQ